MIGIFLILAALGYLIYASVSDLIKREVPNWLSFSLIGFALAYRAFFAVLNSDLWFFLSGIIFLGIFIAFGYGFYYARVFAGGDAKLLMAFGAVLPVSNLADSAFLSAGFIFLLLFMGGLWGLLFSLSCVLKNKKEFRIEFLKQIKKRKKLIYVFSGIAIASLALIYFDFIFISFSVIFLIFPFLFAYAKAAEESCMIFSVFASELTEGDWLYESVKFRGKTIKPNWEGLSEEELKILKNYKKKLKIKQGIPFVPAFLFAFLFWIYSYNFFLAF